MLLKILTSNSTVSMNEEMHEITAISDHKRCFSKAVFDMTDVPGYPGIGCTCKTDTVESKIVGTESFRNWQFPKGRNPFKIGQVVPVSALKTGRSLGAIQEAEAKKAAKRDKALAEAEEEKGKQ